ncbi:aldolase [Viridothelium virens]|uniref:Fructose-bisphosphate aldolase n=1 Tax=Viridothelium virens TaxID=1048519 RepID=A0A6A6HKE8_VIRVR|nr:aldolase [Viridothelium virens]
MVNLRDWHDSKTIHILKDAEERGYGIIASMVYNIEQIIGVVRAAEQNQSPLIIQVFPWAITFSDGLLVRTAADAASRASVPIAIHLDHYQDEKLVRYAADYLPFDSIMIDMSHHEKAVNLAKTRELVAYCHARGIATEAEPGRIEGGEDGVADTIDMQGILTTPEEVEEFIATGVDFVAPAFGNVHGEYGPAGPQLNFDQRKQVNGRVKLVVHGTNGFPPELLQRCIRAGVSKINVNKLVLENYTRHLQSKAPYLTMTRLMEEGVSHVIGQQKEQMDICWSSGKARPA